MHKSLLLGLFLLGWLPITAYAALLPPVITTHPVSQMVAIGSPVTFEVEVTSPTSPSYQWRKDGVDIPGAVFSAYTIASVQVSDQAEYSVRVSNLGGSATSANATLTVLAINGAPVNTVPGAQSTPEDTPLVFSSENSNPISVSDADAGSNEVEVTLSVDSGTLTVAFLPETLALTTANATETGTQEHGDIAFAPDGSYFVVWTGRDIDAQGVYVQRFDADGVAIGAEFLVNTTTASAQRDPAIAMDSAGNFVVVWDSYSQDRNNTYGVYGQRFDATGNKIGGEFLINSTTAGGQYSPDIAMSASGDFVVAWVGNGMGDADGVFLQRFDASANLLGGQVLVNTTTKGEQTNARIVMDASGNLVVSWELSNAAVFVQRFDALGSAQGGEITVANDPAENEQDASIAIRDDGSFAMVWTQGTGPAPGTYVQLYDNAGNATGGAIQVSTSGQSYPDIIATADGGFAISWTAGTDAMLQRHDAAGGLLGAPVVVGSAANLGESSLAVDPTGCIGIVFDGVDSSFGGVFIKQYATPALTFTTGTGSADSTMTFTGTISDINTALDGLIYTPSGGYNGITTLTITSDDQGNTGAGGALQDVATVNITVGNPNATVIDLNIADGTSSDYVTTWTEDGGGVLLAPGDASLIDSDENLTSLTVTITNLLDGTAESLSANPGATGFSVNYDSATGVLTISGAGAAAQYEQVLRTVIYDSTSQNPTTTSRVITFTPTDGMSDGNTATTTLAITVVNTTPTNSVPVAQTTSQDKDLVFSTDNSNSISVSDPDAAASEIEVTLSVNDGTLTFSSLPAATPETLANTTTADSQSSPSIAVAADGSYVMVWQSLNQDGNSWGVYAQRFDANAQPVGREILIPNTTTGSQTSADVAISDTGEFVVVWNSLDSDGNGVFGRRFDASGNALGSEFQINTYTTSNQNGPEIAMDSAGNFVVIWTSLGQDGSGEGIYKQSYDSTGAKVGGEVQVNASTANPQSYHSVDMNDAGEYVITWGSALQDGDSWGVYAQRFDAAGKVGGEFLVNTTTTGIQYRTDVAIDPSGSFVVVWDDQSALDGDGNGIFLQLFDAAGAKVGVETQANTTTAGNQQTPQVKMQDDGTFLVAWVDSANSNDVVGQLFDASGSKVGDETILSSSTAGSQTAVAIAVNGTGTYAVAWGGSGTGDSAGAFGRLFGDENVSYQVGDGDADATITLRGTVAQINGLLDGMIYTPTGGFNGIDTLTITTDDQGNTGAGGAQQDIDTVSITVTPTTPTVLTQPQSVTVAAGQDASFSVVVLGSGPLSYQWLLNGNPLTDANESTLMLNNVSKNDAGYYSVVVKSEAGSISSASAALAVTNPPPVLSSGGSASMTPDGFSFGLSVPVGATYIIEASSNHQDWTPIATNIATSASVVFTDPAAANFPMRLYRAAVQ